MTTPAVDTQLSDLIPESVRRQAEQIDKFIADETERLNAATVTPDPATVTPEPEVKVVEEPVVETPPAKVEEPPVAIAVDKKEESRIKVMEGLNKAAGREAREARAEAQALREELRILKEQKPAVPARVEPKVDEAMVSRLSEAFGGENLKDMVEYMRSQGFVVTQDLEQVRNGVENVAKNVTESAQERFESAMENLASDWKTVNKDPKFIAFMDEEEGNTGMSRIEFARLHFERKNAPKLAKYFIDFADTAEAPAAVVVAKPKLDKKALAAPKATPPAATPLVDGEEPKVKLSEFAKLEEDFRAGKYESRDPEKNKVLQAKFFAEQKRLEDAQRRGNIIPG